MSQSINQLCEQCGASLSDCAGDLTWEGRNLCANCFIKLSVNPEARLAKCGGRCEQCSAELNQSGTVFLMTGGVICLNCENSNRVANWHKEKLPGAPEACEQCGESFVGSDVAFLWLGQAQCLECHNKIREAHPELMQFQLIPLVNLELGPRDVRELPKWMPEDQSKHLN